MCKRCYFLTLQMLMLSVVVIYQSFSDLFSISVQYTKFRDSRSVHVMHNKWLIPFDTNRTEQLQRSYLKQINKQVKKSITKENSEIQMSFCCNQWSWWSKWNRNKTISKHIHYCLVYMLSYFVPFWIVLKIRLQFLL